MTTTRTRTATQPAGDVPVRPVHRSEGRLAALVHPAPLLWTAVVAAALSPRVPPVLGD
jgi:hypothetical protein